METVLGDKGAQIKAREIMYTALVQAVLLYRREIWVVTNATMAVI